MKWLFYLAILGGGYFLYQSWSKDAIRVEVATAQVAQVATDVLSQGKRKLQEHAPELREKMEGQVKKGSKALNTAVEAVIHPEN